MARHGDGGKVSGMMRRPVIMGAVFFAVFSLAGCASLASYNPATERREYIFIPTATEVQMGRDVHAKLKAAYNVDEDSDQARRLTEIGRRVAAVSDRQDYTYHFYLIKNKELNAFTTPGGYIYVFSGLMDKLQTDDQIAAVLGHEVGHCAARHAIKKFQGVMAYNVIGGLVFNQLGLEGTGQEILSMTSSQVISLIFSAYSRKDEYEADRLGLKYTSAGGYDPRGLRESLRIIETASSPDRIPLFLRTHPYLHDRIKVIDEWIAGRRD